jgi:hypothetical protein
VTLVPLRSLELHIQIGGREALPGIPPGAITVYKLINLGGSQRLLCHALFEVQLFLD